MADKLSVWDAIFARDGVVFAEPHERMPSLADALEARGAQRVLDLGCGTGRHLVYLAARGFAVSGLDGAPTGLAMARDRLNVRGLAAELCQGDIFSQLPYGDATFGAVIAVQVIHHALLAAIEALVAELRRVLVPDGLAFVTVPSLRNQGKHFEQIEPGTYVPLDGREAGLPHHYFTPYELRTVFSSFDVTDVQLDRDAHYCLTAFNR